MTVQAVATARVLAQSPEKGRSLVPRLLTIAEDVQGHRPVSGWRPFRLCREDCAQVDAGALLVPARPARSRAAGFGSHGTAADVLSRAKLTPSQLDALADSLKSAGPLEVDRLLTAFEQTDR